MALSIDEQIVEADSDDSDDKLMMTEYDEDNVIVIDLSEERNGSTKNLELTGQDVPDHLRPERPRKTMFGSSDEAEHEPQPTVVIANTEAEAEVEASLNGTPSQQPDVNNGASGMLEYLQFLCRVFISD